MVYGRVVSVDIGVGLLSGVGVPNYRRLSRSRISQASGDGNEVNEKGKAKVEVDDDDDFGALPRSSVQVYLGYPEADTIFRVTGGGGLWR
jgi:hypothetical protein